MTAQLIGERMMEDAGEWDRRPFHRHKDGIWFKLGPNQIGGFAISAVPYVHVWNGMEWILPSFDPRPTSDGGMIYPGNASLKLAGGTIFGGHGRAAHLRSAGVLDRGVYHPLWRVGAVQATPFEFVQDLGVPNHAIEWRLRLREGAAKEIVTISEMPSLVHGDGLAFEWDIDRMLAPELCPCKPWWIDSAGRMGDVRKMRWGGGRIEYVPFSVLEDLIFPVTLDPETSVYGYECFTTCQASTYPPARACTGVGSFPFAYPNPPYGYQSVGQYHLEDEPSHYGILRSEVGWAAGTVCNTLTEAWIKHACWLRIGDRDDDIYFKHSQYDGIVCSNANARTLQNMTDTVGTTKVGNLNEMQAAGCSIVTPTYAPYYALNAADVLHLNTYYGFGNPAGKPLYCGFQTEDDYLSNPPAVSWAHAELIYLWEAMLKYTGIPCGGGWVWLVA